MDTTQSNDSQPLGRWCVAVLCVCLALAGAQPAVATKGGASPEQQPLTPWEGVEELAEDYDKNWAVGLYDIASGAALVTAGALRLARHRSRGRAEAGRWGFPWFGLYFTLTGAGAVASGVYLAASKGDRARYPRAMLRADLSEEAALLYLEHRARVAKRERILAGVSVMASTVAGGVYVMSLPKNSRAQRIEYYATGGGTAAVGVGLGIWQLVRRSLEERILQRVQVSTVSEPTQRTARLRVRPFVGPRSERSIRFGFRLGFAF